MTALSAILFVIGLILAASDTMDPTQTITIPQILVNLTGLILFTLSLYLASKTKHI